jgi:protein-S-isoprenylcysteine O-methyltransferase Ste14
MTRERTGALAFAWFGALLFISSLLLLVHAYLVTFGSVTPDGPAIAALLTDVGLFSIFALHHSVFARTGVKLWMTRLVSSALERSVYTWTASVLLIAVVLLWRPVPGALYEARGLWTIPFYAIQLVGVLLTVRSSSTLGILDLAGIHQAQDAVDSSEAHVPLVTTGLYGFVRHPLYFSWLLFVFGTPRMTTTRLTFAVVSSAYLAIAIPFEERGLIRTFGEDYRRYQRDVRWRMLPGVY